MVITLNATARFNRSRARLGGKELPPPRRTGRGLTSLRQPDDRQRWLVLVAPLPLDRAMGFEVIRLPAASTSRGHLDPVAAARVCPVRVAADRVIEKLCRIAFADIGELFDQSGRILPLPSIPPSIRPAVASYTLRRVRSRNGGGEVVAVRLHSKLRALNVLARHFGMYRKDQSLDHRTR